MQNKNRYSGREIDNYQDVENPHYESKDPYKVKHNAKHSRQYIYDLIVLGIIIVGAIIGIYFWVNS